MKSKLIKILTIILIVFTITNVYAKGVEVKDRNDLDNYGVNKKWNITDKNKGNVLNTPCVDANEKIYDFSDVLTDEEEKELKKEIDKFIEETKMDMVIVIPEFSYINDNENENYAADFYDYNDFGIEFNKYSGVLLLRNTYEADPYFNIYTFGEAQLYFSYNRLENTLDSIYYDIKNKNYPSGFSRFVEDMKKYYKIGIPSEMKSYTVDDMGYLQKLYRIPWLISLLISGIITGIIMAILISKNKMVIKATKAAEYLDKNSVNITRREQMLIGTHTTSHVIDSGGSGGGFHSSGGSSGGGHSSGGGRHG